jgi:hypothetical protein
MNRLALRKAHVGLGSSATELGNPGHVRFTADSNRIADIPDWQLSLFDNCSALVRYKMAAIAKVLSHEIGTEIDVDTLRAGPHPLRGRAAVIASNDDVQVRSERF